ncbi:hypothetical protein ACEZCY_14120 [Streptacidiphilus sp. N1-12]|uniref:Uncharacterized protein n=2 Tax=Streptacidiphilus alkalitolerans TaxID=3342712 RepID=A0ABV6V9N7_9ACTN
MAAQQPDNETDDDDQQLLVVLEAFRDTLQAIGMTPAAIAHLEADFRNRMEVHALRGFLSFFAPKGDPR